MHKKIPLYAVILLVLFSVLIAFQCSFVAFYKGERQSNKSEPSDTGDQASSTSTDTSALMEKLTLIDNLYRQYYVGEIDQDKLVYYTMLGYIVGTGDKHGEYITAESYDAMINAQSGENQGIGIMVVDTNGYIEVVDVIADSPADKAGMQIGDIVIKVGDKDAGEMGYNDALTAMQGEKGTHAVFTVQRNDQTIDFDILRDTYESKSVIYHMYEDGKTGIIRITTFNDYNVPEQFKAAVEDLQKQGATQLVFDVRSNPGGILEVIRDVLDYLCPEGEVIRITDNQGNESSLSSDASEINMPMAVLVNGSTASAAELFTACLRDYGKSITIGTTTYGKGTMQSIIPFSDGSALRISNHMYSPPKSDNYDGVGITPDIEIELDEGLAHTSFYKIADKDDNQLQAAVTALNENN